MNLQNTIDLHASGTSEGSKKAWDKRGRGRKEVATQSRARWRQELQKASKLGQKVDGAIVGASKANEFMLAQVLGGQAFKVNNAFDVHYGNRTGIEQKNRFPGSTNDKVNIHAEDRMEHGQSILDHGFKSSYTVVFDLRDWGFKPVTEQALSSGKVPILIKSGTAAYRYDGMQKVSLNELRDIVKNQRWVFPTSGSSKDPFGSFTSYIKNRGWESGGKMSQYGRVIKPTK